MNPFNLSHGYHKLVKLDPITSIFHYERSFQEHGKRISEDTLLQMFKLSHGFEFPMELLCYLAWENSDRLIGPATIKTFIPAYKEDLVGVIYPQLLRNLSTMDKKFIAAMGSYSSEEVPMKYIRQKLHKEKNYLSNYRRRLLDDQLIVSTGWGLVSFTLPYFQDFVRQFGDSY